MAENTLLAGVARVVISPPPGIYLIGYGDRAKGNQGVHDDLTATALVVDDGQTRLALVACDLLCLNEYIVDRARADLGSGIAAVICCSHTHSGPIAYADERSSRANQDYIHTLVERLVRVVRQAEAQLAPARLTLAQTEAGIAINRRERQADGKVVIGINPAGPVDRSVSVVSVHLTPDPSPGRRGEIGNRRVTLVNYACHGTVLGPGNLLVSADWIGAMRQKVEAELGGLALFLQGATGDLNPAMEWESERAWQMVKDEGEAVAAAVITAAHGEQVPLGAAPIRIARREAWLPLEAPATSARPPRTYRKRLLAMAGLPSWAWLLTDALLKRRYPWRSRLEARAGVWSTPLRISAARLGELGLVFYGAEVFTEVGLAAKAASPAAHTLFASLSDGCIGYLTTPEAHAEGGYEVDTAPYAYRFPGRLQASCEQIALDTTRQMLAQVWGQE